MTDQPQEKKGGVLKWFLLGCGLLLFLGVAFVAVGGYLIYKNVSTDPAKVESVAQEIVGFQKPEGLTGQFAFSMMGMKMAMLGTGQDPEAGKAIVLMSFPEGKGGRDEMRRQMREKMAEQGKAGEIVEKRGPEKFRVRGQETEATVEVTADKETGRRALQYSIVLDGSAGRSVLLMIMGDEKQIDSAWVQKFLDTVK